MQIDGFSNSKEKRVIFNAELHYKNELAETIKLFIERDTDLKKLFHKFLEEEKTVNDAGIAVRSEEERFIDFYQRYLPAKFGKMFGAGTDKYVASYYELKLEQRILESKYNISDVMKEARDKAYQPKNNSIEISNFILEKFSEGDVYKNLGLNRFKNQIKAFVDEQIKKYDLTQFKESKESLFNKIEKVYLLYVFLTDYYQNGPFNYKAVFNKQADIYTAGELWRLAMRQNANPGATCAEIALLFTNMLRHSFFNDAVKNVGSAVCKYERVDENGEIFTSYLFGKHMVNVITWNFEDKNNKEYKGIVDLDATKREITHKTINILNKKYFNMARMYEYQDLTDLQTLAGYYYNNSFALGLKESVVNAKRSVDLSGNDIFGLTIYLEKIITYMNSNGFDKLIVTDAQKLIENFEKNLDAPNEAYIEYLITKLVWELYLYFSNREDSLLTDIEHVLNKAKELIGEVKNTSLKLLLTKEFRNRLDRYFEGLKEELPKELIHKYENLF